MFECLAKLRDRSYPNVGQRLALSKDHFDAARSSISFGALFSFSLRIYVSSASSRSFDFNESEGLSRGESSITYETSSISMLNARVFPKFPTRITLKTKLNDVLILINTLPCSFFVRPFSPSTWSTWRSFKKIGYKNYSSKFEILPNLKSLFSPHVFFVYYYFFFITQPNKNARITSKKLILNLNF